MTARDTIKGQVRVHDPFELVRWLALSQPDPRKAVAELVQNSLDAGARQIRITRLRERNVVCLKIIDDGTGVIPEEPRPDALKYIATHIGHSRKRSLSPQERLTLMTQGQYGIGLLGFWAIGQQLEMRSAMPGQLPYRLVLYRDQPNYVVEPLRGRLALGERWTEVVIVGVHREAAPVLIGRRLADYLAAELRGQLLERDATVIIEDRMSRGAAEKVIRVVPPRFLGERATGLGPIEVVGHPPIRLELYVTGELGDVTARPIALYAAGTLVCDGFAELGSIGLDHTPWTDARLTGIVDWPSLKVSPGSRRGVIPDEDAGRFATALSAVEPTLNALLASIEQRRADALDRVIIRDLQRAFRDFYRQRPSYTMLPVASDELPLRGPEPTDASGSSVQAGMPELASEHGEQGEEEGPGQLELLPPGPLASVRIIPERLSLGFGERRHVRAIATDADGRRLDPTALAFAWQLSAPVATIADGQTSARLVLEAGTQAGEAMLTVSASDNRGQRAEFGAVLAVNDLTTSTRSREGIPEPELVDQPGAAWRSRLIDDKWQVNSGHRDYRSIADRPTLKLRYFAALFAKEIVLRSHQDPRLDGPLEQVVEVLAYADRNLAQQRSKRAKE